MKKSKNESKLNVRFVLKGNELKMFKTVSEFMGIKYAAVLFPVLLHDKYHELLIQNVKQDFPVGENKNEIN